MRIARRPDVQREVKEGWQPTVFDILAKFRQHPVLKSTPVIMFTAESTREAVLKGLQAGADGYVTKPFEPEAVVNAVNAVLGLSPPPEAAKK